MADDRTRTIVKEIKYWKDHKLLPESQCDFLLALYTKGEDETIYDNKISKYKASLYIQLTLLVLMVPFSFLVVYFTQFKFILQLSILVLFIGYAFLVFRYLYKRSLKFVHISIIVPLIMLLLLTDLVLDMLHINQYLTIIFFLINFVCWFLLGRKLQYRYLMASSGLAIFILLFLNFSHLFSFN
ncbi:hypothetical protein [Ornithinibacillus sp. 179-J 7C1 HS]|uniref:hypothetical protein n=1 Tax=Ornithinibacillus sp. 179-J 7C1 HS TaxID=3142384 RepID=UPI0039A238CB